MARLIALLRAVNVGGTGKLPMRALVQSCADAGFEEVRTYLASGNVVFTTDLPPVQARDILQARLAAQGRAIPVIMRTRAEMSRIVSANPFADRPGDKTLTIFLDDALPAEALTQVTGRKAEEIHLAGREVYVYYPDGAGRSKLKIPGAAQGTARNMNTIAKLLEIATR